MAPRLLSQVRSLANALLRRAGMQIMRVENLPETETSHLLSVLDRYAVDCVLDAGANRGQFARKLRRAGYTGWILSFEPVAEVFTQLCEAAQGDPKWRTFRLALGESAETKEIVVYEHSVFSSFHPVSEYARSVFGELRESRRERVEVCRLDGVVPEQQTQCGFRNLFLKMDTQGFDAAVFRGAAGILPQLRGLQTELPLLQVYDGGEDGFEFVRELTAQGFRISGMFPVNKDPQTLAVIEYDCVMVRHGGEDTSG